MAWRLRENFDLWQGEKQQLEGAILAARKRLEDISEHLASRDARKAVTSSTRQEAPHSVPLAEWSKKASNIDKHKK
eukprot:5107455-Amphidinium_carterae.1